MATEKENLGLYLQRVRNKNKRLSWQAAAVLFRSLAPSRMPVW